jgi:hypothetical protein
MVSPEYKGGYGVLNIEAVSPSGESIAFYSPGAFVGAPSGLSAIDYAAHREAAGWTTVAQMPPSALMPNIGEQDTSSTLESVLSLGKNGSGLEEANQETGEEEFLFHSPGQPDIGSNWEKITPILKPIKGGHVEAVYEGGNADLCHLLFSNSGENVGKEVPLSLEATGTIDQLYELNRGCDGGTPSLKLVALNAKGKAISPHCKVDSGVEDYDTVNQNAYNAISADGSEVFFTTCVAGEVTHHQLFVRLGGTTTLEISKPLSESETCVNSSTCKKALLRASADFVGASEDGSRVYFTTTESLVGEDKDKSEDLYQAIIGCPEGAPGCLVNERIVTSLSQVSRSPTNEAAELQGVVRVSPDGSHVYFVARGVLSSENNAQGEAAIKGADNLYAYNAAMGKTAFIGDLCSGREESGLAEDIHCPNKVGTDVSLWQGNIGEAQTGSQDGDVLVFTTYAQLTGNDTDTAKDVYRYDAETGILTRVSIGEAGADANGNNSEYNATILDGHKGERVRFQYEMDNRAMSEDGSQIIFMSAEPLSPSATNHLADVYMWHEEQGDSEGGVSLLSGGGADAPIEDAVISPSGHDVFFITVQGLVPQDTDGAPDVYDARVDGGFPSTATTSEECSSDGCQGPLTNPAPLLVPGSIVQSPEAAMPVKVVVSSKGKKKGSSKKKAKAKKKKKVRAKRATGRRAKHKSHGGRQQ